MIRTPRHTVVMKFGGTSVGSPEAIKRMIAIVAHSKNKAIVVVSAFSKVTNRLIQAAEMAQRSDLQYKKIINVLITQHTDCICELISDPTLRQATQIEVTKMIGELSDVLEGIYLIKELTPKTLDTVMSYGERLSATIITNSFNNVGIPASFVDARLFIKTDSSFGQARIDMEKTEPAIHAYFEQTSKKLPIVTGFIASTINNETTTLGRSGSDYTAAIIGAALHTSNVEIWTDVNGVLTADPNKVSSAFSLASLTYEEAMEMSHFGAKVIYPQTMTPVQKRAIPIVIRNTFHPEFKGTFIGAHSTNKYHVKGISSLENISLVQIQGSGMQGTPGTVSRLFSALAREKINIIFITQASSEYSVCFAINPVQAKIAKEAIEQEFRVEMQLGLIDPLLIEENLSIIAVVGEQMRHALGISAKIFTSLAREKINVSAIAQGSSERNISFVVERNCETRAINAIHKAFFEDTTTKQLPLFIIGTGNIGSALLRQIHSLNKLNNTNVKLKVVGLANSKKMIIEPNGINLSKWKDQLNQGAMINMELYIKKIIDFKQSGVIFIDCTASDKMLDFYPLLLESGVSVVTPNKKANSADLMTYKKIHNSYADSHACFMYETNVCAGLPILKTLQELRATGDEIYKIEGVLSGTLSYIFNQFKKNRNFYDIVLDAMKNGYTEPDPREDLNGLDVGRKTLILAREIGLLLNLSDIKIENLVPKPCQNVRGVQEFLKSLKNEQTYFENKKLEALSHGSRLSYIATIDVKKKIYTSSLKEVSQSSPFYSLSGSDNIVIITTKHYNKTPMVIKGPGAGSGVTANGVLTDILRIGKYYTFEGFRT